MSHIQKRTTKRGEPRYVVYYRDPAGRQREKWHKTRKAAERFETNVCADVLRGAWVDPSAGKVTLGEFAENWLEHRPGLRPRTRETYDSQYRLHIKPTYENVQLAKITPSSVRTWHSGLIKGGLSHNTAAKCYRMLSAMLNTAVADELIVRNPCKVKGAGIERCDERPTASVEQVLELADHIEARFRCAVLLAAFAGLRRGELLGLERRHVNVLHRTLTIEQQQEELSNGHVGLAPPKTDAGRRTLAIPEFLVAELERHLDRYTGTARRDRVFAGEKGGPLRKLTLHKHWAAAREKVDLPTGFRFHDLRHTANTLTAAEGASLRELMRRMGHASPAAALRYQHATEDRDAAIAKAIGDLAERVQRERGTSNSMKKRSKSRSAGLSRG